MVTHLVNRPVWPLAALTQLDIDSPSLPASDGPNLEHELEHFPTIKMIYGLLQALNMLWCSWKPARKPVPNFSRFAGKIVTISREEIFC